MAKIYLASSWRNEEQPSALAALQKAGHDVYDFRNPPGGIPNGFRWAELDAAWESWSAKDYRAKLSHPLAQRGFNSDFNGMKWADVGVLLLPCGRSAHLELGWMAGAGKKTIIWTRDGQEPELMALLATTICTSLEEVLYALQNNSEIPSTKLIPPVDRTAIELTGGTPVTSDHREINPVTGLQKAYVVLTPDERAKGFSRPYRDAYRHLSCGTITTMSRSIAETYARDPYFYSGTFCAQCRAHFPIGEDGEFTWYEMDGREGPKVGT